MSKREKCEQELIDDKKSTQYIGEHDTGPQKRVELWAVMLGLVVLLLIVLGLYLIFTFAR